MSTDALPSIVTLPCVVATPLPDSLIPSLPDDLPLLQQMIRELLGTLHQTQIERDGLQQRLDLLLRKLYGPKAERFDPNQPLLFPEMTATPDAAAPSDPASAVPIPPAPAPAASDKPPRSGHGRKPLPKNLRRERIVHEVPEALRRCSCCGGTQEAFGEEISEQLDFVPASLFVKQHVRLKYACQKCHEGVTIADKPAQPIEKGLPGPGLLAQIAASKYADHLPLFRLERIFARQGVELSRSTMCGWMREIADLVRPVVDAMWDEILGSRVLHTDATKMPYLDADAPGKTRSGQMWVYVGDREHPFHVFDFCDDHSGKRIRKLLADYQGCLSADALNVYDGLFVKLGQPILEVGCWAHCRRHFFDAKGNDAARAHEALARIGRLYALEGEAKKRIAQHELAGAAADAVFFEVRQSKSRLEVIALREWLEREQPRVLPKSLIGQAIGYALNHWTALTRFLDAGHLALDNNVAENALRMIALGRKNWLFAGNAQGARTAATLFSLTSSCHRHGLDTFVYLRDLIERLTRDPKPDADTLRSLMPDRWRPPDQPPPSVPNSSSPTSAGPTA